ncbi:hypothetical protein WN943_015604 [Citrus x changshan-huyou]
MIISWTPKYTKGIIVLCMLSKPHFHKSLTSNCSRRQPVYQVTCVAHSFRPKRFIKLALDNIHRTFSSKVQFIRSATSFCSGVCITVKYLLIPLFWHTCKNGSEVYSPPLLDRNIVIFLSV